MSGLAKKYITKLGCEKIFLQGHILSTAGDALIAGSVHVQSSLHSIAYGLFYSTYI